MLCARFFINFYPWLVVAPSMISALNAARSCAKPQLFLTDKLLVTAQKRSDVATTQPERQQPQAHQNQYQRQHLQQRRHQRLSTSAFCGHHQRQSGAGEQQQPHFIHNCTAINATADNFPTEIQQQIEIDNENEIPTENHRVEDDLLPKNVSVVPQTSSSASTSKSTLSTSNTSPSSASSSSSRTSPSLVPPDFQLNRILSRRKRYLAFPEGSSLSVAVCFTVGIIGNPRYDYMSFGLNWGVAYDLPNASWVLNHLHGFSRHPVPPTVLRRRTRSMLYKEVESALENMGYEGRDCVLRALCESRQYFNRSKMGMIGEMLRVIFSLPKQRIFSRELHENAEIGVYDHAYRKTRSANCALQYPCSFSLLELALGRYSTPPAGYYKQH